MAIEGTPGRDYLYGTTASDMLIGKGGGDELYGYAGNDSYLFSAFDGDDYVSDSAGIDRVVFDATVSRSDIRLATEYYGDLIVMNEDTGDELRLDGQFDGGPYRIEKISFADGSSIDLTAPLIFTGDVEGNSIYATSGNDTLIGKGGNDNLYGGAGGDTYVFGPYDGRDYIDDSGGPDGIRFEAGVRFAELSFLNDGFNDLLIRNGSTADVIEINNQFVAGTNRVETLSFADGSRYTWNGVEFARVSGGPIPGSGDDTLTGTANADTIDALAGNDTILGQGGNDILIGNVGHDIVDGEAGNDEVHGNDGNDRVYGGEGDDQVYGEIGNDTVQGGPGNDRVGGGTGVDILTGNLGVDTFHFVSGSSTPLSRDTITDFRGDRLDLSLIDANASRAGNQAFTFVGTGVPDAAGEVGFVKSGGNTFVRGNTDADAAFEFEVKLTGNITLVSGDFVL